MPRPLPKKSRVNDKFGVNPMIERPELAVMIARIAVGWARTEERLGRVIVHLLQAEARTGMRMYQALTGSAAQLAVLRAVARDRLEQADQDRLETILSAFKKAATKRNKIIHGHWYVSDYHPTELVWTDPADEMSRNSEFWAGYSAARDAEIQMEFLRGFKGEPPKRLLYNKQEFQSILEEFVDVAEDLRSFCLHLQNINDAARDKTRLTGQQS